MINRCLMGLLADIYFDIMFKFWSTSIFVNTPKVLNRAYLIQLFMPVSSDNNLTADISIIFPAGAMALPSELSIFQTCASDTTKIYRGILYRNLRATSMSPVPVSWGRQPSHMRLLMYWLKLPSWLWSIIANIERLNRGLHKRHSDTLSSGSPGSESYLVIDFFLPKK